MRLGSHEAGEPRGWGGTGEVESGAEAAAVGEAESPRKSVAAGQFLPVLFQFCGEADGAALSLSSLGPLTITLLIGGVRVHLYS